MPKGRHHFHGGIGIFIGEPLWGPWPNYYYPPPAYFNQMPPAYIEQGQSYW